MLKNDIYFLKIALKQAKIRRGFCSPNPSVGSLIVDKDKNILSKSYHPGAGSPHAEVQALKQLDFKVPPESTLYVTLEPCCHWGKTPPCVDAIKQAGFKRVVYAFKDPNPLVSGRGAAVLNQAGIPCDHVPLKLVDDFYQAYQYWQRTGQPFVTGKLALSLNGAISNALGDPVQITGKELLKFTHQSRSHSDAILTTVATIRHDNPQLNVRIDNKVLAKPVYVLDTYLKFPDSARLFETASSITIFHGNKVDLKVREQFIKKGVHCIEVEQLSDGLNLSQVLILIGKDGVHDLWVEAGGRCFAAFVNHKLFQRAYIYISLRWLKHGKIAFPKGISLDEMSQLITWRQFGKDALCDIRF